MQTLLIKYLIIGGLLAVLSIPLIRRRVPPNYWYGFRVPQTLEDPEIWYAVNAHLGRRLIWVGILIIVTALVCSRVPGMNKDTFAWIILALLIVSLTITIAWSTVYLRSLRRH